MAATPNPQERLRRQLGGLRVPPTGTAAKKLRPLAEAAFRDPVTLQAFRKALDGQVDAAGAFAEALRPGWHCTIEDAPLQEGAGPHVIARLKAPGDANDAAESWAARPAGYPAFALVVATLESFAPQTQSDEQNVPQSQSLFRTLIGYAVIAILLVLGAAFLQALVEVTWEELGL